MLLFDPKPFTANDFWLSVLLWAVTVLALVNLSLFLAMIMRLVLEGTDWLFEETKGFIFPGFLAVSALVIVAPWLQNHSGSLIRALELQENDQVRAVLQAMPAKLRNQLDGLSVEKNAAENLKAFNELPQETLRSVRDYEIAQKRIRDWRNNGFIILLFAPTFLMFSEVLAFVSGLMTLSVARIGALAKLTFLEAVRRRALLIFVVFGLLFMFAGWFMTDTKQEAAMQVKVHVVFVLTTITWLIMPVILLLSCWGLPEDIRLRSLHTVVTKPVHRMEIVLGRIFGYTGVGVLVLSVMSVVGFIWISRQVPEEARGELTARRPKWGSLTFKDRMGEAADAGINVGDIDNMRSFIEGATKARAVWRFTRVDENSFVGTGDDAKLVLESHFQAFRSFKGDMSKSLMYQFYFCNEKTGLKVPDSEIHNVREFRYNLDEIPRKLRVAKSAVQGLEEGVGKVDGDIVELDLLKDVTSPNGTLVVEVAGIDRQQYLGMARPDLFIRLPDASFAVGYFKSVIGIGLTLFLVVVLGVTASTFVKGPVATLTTFTLVAIGHWERARIFLVNLTDELMSKGQVTGGGLLESIYRIVTYMNPTTELPSGFAFQMMKRIDFFFFSFLWLVRQIIPNFDHFNKMPQYVANGFDVPFMATLVPSFLLTIGFFIPCVVLGYYALRLRELEAK